MHFHELVAGHVVGEIGHNDSSFSGFLDRRARYLDEVAISVDVHLALLVIDDVGGRQDLTVALVEMEERLHVVDMRSDQEVRWAQVDSEPDRHRQVLIPVEASRRGLVNLHVDPERHWVEVDHDLLLTEPEALPSRCDDVVDVAVYSLFNEDVRRVDLVDVPLDVHERSHSLLETDGPPPLLDAQGSTLADDQIDRLHGLALARKVGSELLLHSRYGRLFLEQRVEETQELLVLFLCSIIVVVEDSKQQMHHKPDSWSLEVKQVVVSIVEHHLVQE